MTDPKLMCDQGPPPQRPDGGRMGWIPYLVICGAGLTFGLTWIGPRAAEGLGTPSAMAFWAAHVAPALVILALTQTALSQLRPFAAWPGLAQVAVTGLVASVLFTPVALGVDLLFGAEAASDQGGGPLVWVAAVEFAQFSVPIVLTWTLINAPSLLTIEAPTPDPAPPGTTPPAPARTPEPEFWARIPRRLGRDIVAMTAELHYLRVHTTLGDALILYPFGRATDAVAGLRGMKIHRSHWVALDHVAEVSLQEGRTLCHMAGGLALPVSRSHRAALKAALG